MRTDFRQIVIDERTTPVYTAIIKDAVGTPIPLAQIASLTLTLYDQVSKTIINSRDDQDVLNANGVEVAVTSGQLTWSMDSLDTAIGNLASYYESRVAQFTWTYGGDKRGTHEIAFTVRNLEKVT